MNCSRVKEILVDYAEGALSGRKKAAVEDHLTACEACRGELSQIETLKENILSVETPEHDADFWQRFNKKLSQRLADIEEPMSGRRFSWQPRYSFAAAAMVLLVVLSIGILREAREPGDTAPVSDPETTWLATIEPDDLETLLFISTDYDETDLYLSDSDSETVEQLADDLLLMANGDFEAMFEESLFDDSGEESIDETLEDFSQEELEELYRRMGST